MDLHPLTVYKHFQYQPESTHNDASSCISFITMKPYVMNASNNHICLCIYCLYRSV